MTIRDGLHLEHSILITAEPVRVLTAFFDASALPRWWKVIRSVTIPRPMGIYAVEWETTPFQADVLGYLGGIFYGVVMEFRSGKEFFLADAYWLPPEGPPIGPMALEVTCHVEGPATRLSVRQSATDDGIRWKRYSELIEKGWQDSLETLKKHLEQGSQANPDKQNTRAI